MPRKKRSLVSLGNLWAIRKLLQAEQPQMLLTADFGERIAVVRRYGDLGQVECCPGEINQVFMSLIANGIEAIDGEGKITIATSVENGEIAIRFSDTGRGIAESDTDRIFEPGFTKKGVGVGTGLGLSTSFQTMEKHGGRIEVESAEGSGTTMILRIPV